MIVPTALSHVGAGGRTRPPRLPCCAFSLGAGFAAYAERRR